MSAATPPATSAAPRHAWSERLFSLPVLMGLGLAYLLSFYANPGGKTVAAVADTDIWWHLRNAAELLATRHFPHTAPWTFTVPGQPWMNGEWLSELPYYFAYRALGDRGLYLVMMLVTGVIVLGVYLLAHLRAGRWKEAFAGGMVAVVFATVSLAPRTLLFGWLALVAELAVLWSLEKGRDFTPWLPVIFLLWVNLHGSWFIGFVMMLVYFAGGWIEGRWGDLYAVRWTPRLKRRLLIVTALSFAALFVNPYGWRLVAYPLDVAYGQKLMIQSAAEWSSLNFHDLRGKIVLLVLAILAVLQLVRRRRWSVQDLAFAAIAIYGAFSYSRFLFLAGMLIGPFLAMSLSAGPENPPAPNRRQQGINALAIAAVLVLIVLRVPSEQQLRAGVAADYPEKAIPWVRSLAGQGNLFNDFNWGGYLEWNAPQVSEFADTRLDVFVHHGILADYLRAAQLQDPLEVLDRYRIRYALLYKKSPLAYFLQRSPGWKTEYDDGQAVALERVP